MLFMAVQIDAIVARALGRSKGLAERRFFAAKMHALLLNETYGQRITSDSDGRSAGMTDTNGPRLHLFVTES